MSKTPYEVKFTSTALKNLKRYPKPDQQRIIQQIEELASDPYSKVNVKRLVNFDVSYRMRVGNYRVLFDLEDQLKIVDVIDILHRSKAYRRK